MTNTTGLWTWCSLLGDRQQVLWRTLQDREHSVYCLVIGNRCCDGYYRTVKTGAVTETTGPWTQCSLLGDRQQVLWRTLQDRENRCCDRHYRTMNTVFTVRWEATGVVTNTTGPWTQCSLSGDRRQVLWRTLQDRENRCCDGHYRTVNTVFTVRWKATGVVTDITGPWTQCSLLGDRRQVLWRTQWTESGHPGCVQWSPQGGRGACRVRGPRAGQQWTLDFMLPSSLCAQTVRWGQLTAPLSSSRHTSCPSHLAQSHSPRWPE